MSIIDDISSRSNRALQRYRGVVAPKDCHVVVETIKTDFKHPIHANLDRLLTQIELAPNASFTNESPSSRRFIGKETG